MKVIGKRNKKSGKAVMSGKAFVEFTTEEAAAAALEAINGHALPEGGVLRAEMAKEQ